MSHDVGGGLGVFCYGFKDHFPDWSTLCVEPTEGANVISERHGVPSFNSYLSPESRDKIGADYDLITANHVVEHVDEPVEFLRLLSSYLAAEGLIYIEMPSTEDLGFLDKSHDRFMCQHEVIYDEKSVGLIAMKADLKVVHCSLFELNGSAA